MNFDESPRLSLPLLSAGQAQKEVTHNEALQRLDALVQPVACSADAATPPVEPSVGDCWIIAAGATGDWAGRAGDVAQWSAGGWRFVTPSSGWRCHVTDRGADMMYDGMTWQDGQVRADGIYISGEKVMGERSLAIADPAGGTIIDDKARGVINEILTMLRGNGMILS